MSFTGRMRLALVLMALLPPIITVSAVWWYTSNRTRSEAILRANSQLSRIEQVTSLWQAETAQAVEAAANDSRLQSAVLQLGRNPESRPSIAPLPAGADFLEIVDSNGVVLASARRPGLIGSRIRLPRDAAAMAYTTEYDYTGSHPSLAVTRPLAGGFSLYGGRYLHPELVDILTAIGQGTIDLVTTDSLDRTWLAYEDWRLYDHDNGASLRARILGSEPAGFLLTMTIDPDTAQPIRKDLIAAAVLVSVLSMLAALAIGWYLTGKAKREVDNLIEASHRVAAGDFSTPVMAYEEGEFAQLADSLSDMMSNLKRVQRELATAEKIAAWQAMGRKIAHEVKNPLTPIAISIDDLRRSHAEKLPEFDGILQETTATIKAEVTRLTQLLDQFVSFARMTPPDLRTRPIKDVFSRLQSLHRATVENGRLVLLDRETGVQAHYDIDRIEQVLVNLIKNSLETGPDTRVTVDIAGTSGDTVMIRVTDTGPGFPESVLQQAFEPKVSDKSGGFGLGLVICHRIVHDHGGELRVGNSPQGGADITFTLPRNHGENSDHR